MSHIMAVNSFVVKEPVTAYQRSFSRNPRTMGHSRIILLPQSEQGSSPWLLWRL